MSPADTSASNHKTPAASRPGRTQVLRTAQIYEVKAAEAMPTGDLCVAVVVGDEQCEPHTHGLRAPRARWALLFGALVSEDPELGALMRAQLHA